MVLGCSSTDMRWSIQFLSVRRLRRNQYELFARTQVQSSDRENEHPPVDLHFGISSAAFFSNFFSILFFSPLRTEGERFWLQEAFHFSGRHGQRSSFGGRQGSLLASLMIDSFDSTRLEDDVPLSLDFARLALLAIVSQPFKKVWTMSH